MKAHKAFIFFGLVLGLVVSGCQKKESAAGQAAVYRLFDLFQPEDLTDKLNPEEAGWKPVEWQAGEIVVLPTQGGGAAGTLVLGTKTNAQVGVRVLKDFGDIRLEQGKLTAESRGASSALLFSLGQDRGGAESVKFIEVRMNVTGAKQVWLRAEGSGNPDQVVLSNWAAQTEAWKSSADVVEGKVQTYRFEVASARGPAPGKEPVSDKAPAGAAPMAGQTAAGASVSVQKDGFLRHFVVALRECRSARVSIESIRFVTEREEKLKEPSGQLWAGLSEIYQASLVAKTPESIRVPLRALPEKAWLEFSYGTKEDAPVRFKVSIGDRTAAKGTAAVTIFERTVTVPNRWQSARVDLSAFAGKSVLVEFSLTGEKKGLWGYWGAPTVRSPMALAAGAVNKPRGVIFLVIDTLRKDHLNIYGYPRETTVHLKKFAEEGVAFSHAISQGTMTKISIPSMVTSLYPLSHTVLGFDKGLPASARTIAEVFRDEGFATVAYSSVTFTGKGNNMHQGYDELHESVSISDGEFRSKTSRHYVDRVIPWLKEHRDAPFFVFLHVFDPHSPFRPRKPYDTLWGAPGSKERLEEIEADMKRKNIKTGMDSLPAKEDYLKSGNDPDELLKIYTDWYDGSIRGVDAEIGRLLEALKELQIDKDTLMVFATDHGEEFWEHGKLFHGHSVYGELNQVPMVYRWPNSPRIRKGAMVDHQVQNLDIMPTLLELAGVQGPTNMQGRSLVPLLDGSGVASWKPLPAITQAMVDEPKPGGGSGSGAKPHFGIIEQGWKLIRKEIEPDARQELYEHPIDYLNLTNVIGATGGESRVKSLFETLEAWKVRARAAQLPSDESMSQELSSEELRRLRALGYVGGGGTPSPARPTTNAVAKTNAPGTAAPSSEKTPNPK